MRGSSPPKYWLPILLAADFVHKICEIIWTSQAIKILNNFLLSHYFLFIIHLRPSISICLAISLYLESNSLLAIQVYMQAVVSTLVARNRSLKEPIKNGHTLPYFSLYFYRLIEICFMVNFIYTISIILWNREFIHIIHINTVLLFFIANVLTTKISCDMALISFPCEHIR